MAKLTAAMFAFILLTEMMCISTAHTAVLPDTTAHYKMERLVILPLRVVIKDRKLQSNMEAALVEGLMQK
jgi:hypothetical protein